MAIDFKDLNQAYEAEFQKQKNVPSRPISQIEWFASNMNEGTKQPKQNLHELLMKEVVPTFQKSVTDKRPDQIFRKTKIVATLGKYTSNLVRFDHL